MAVTKSNYSWSGIEINAYAKIWPRTIEDITIDGIKQYSCTYRVKVYTSSDKTSIAETFDFQFLDWENPTINMCYSDLATREEFIDWVSDEA